MIVCIWLIPIKDFSLDRRVFDVDTKIINGLIFHLCFDLPFSPLKFWLIRFRFYDNRFEFIRLASVFVRRYRLSFYWIAVNVSYRFDEIAYETRTNYASNTIINVYIRYSIRGVFIWNQNRITFNQFNHHKSLCLLFLDRYW